MKLDAPATIRRHGLYRLYSRHRHRLVVVLGTLALFGLLSMLRGTGRSKDCRGGIPLPHVLAKQQKDGATPNIATTATGWRPGPRCENYPRDASLVIVVKTGATEAYSKLPTLLLTYLSCVPPENLLFFSDMAGTVGNFAIHDSLDTARWAATHKNPDFDLYHKQQEIKGLGQDMGSIRNEGKAESAWRLDKYKNLYTAQKAWDLAPERDWYMYIDADTYISWTNLFHWLATYDASQPLYLGSQIDVGDPPFAHGGSGYMISKPAMELLVGSDRQKLAKQYDKNATTACCGDQEIAKVLFKKGLRLKNVRPVINGEKLKRFNFGPELWCTPVVTMHHIGSEEVQEMWDFESHRNSTKEPLLAEELYYMMIASLMGTPRRDDWDNLSPAKQIRPEPLFKPAFVGNFFVNDSTKSYNTCRRACEEDNTCFQFVYYKDTCKLDTAFKLGSPAYPWKEEGEEIKIQSGWMVDRIKDFVTQNSPCKGPNWDADS